MLHSIQLWDAVYYFVQFIRIIPVQLVLCRGATHSKLVLYNGMGEMLVQVDGLGTNHWVC